MENNTFLKKTDISIPGGVLAIDTSTKHLSPSDQRLLGELSEINLFPLPRTAPHDYGWVIFLPPKQDLQEAQSLDATQDPLEAAFKTHRVGPGLAALIRYGLDQGAYFVNLDADMEPLHGFPVFDEPDAWRIAGDDAIYAMGDQPMVCPSCGVRSAFEQLNNTRQQQLHTCLNKKCRKLFIAEPADV